MAFDNTININEGLPALSDNLNFLSPLGFRFLLNRAPNVEYFCQAATLPGISMAELNQQSPFVNIPRPGDKITYEDFTIRFRVDEDLHNYLEVHDWIQGLGHPEDLEQYKKLVTGPGAVSDGSIMVLTSNSNASVQITFKDMFPLSLQPLEFNTTSTDIEYLECEVTFKYRDFEISRINTDLFIQDSPIVP